jgi:hypothetical protein
MQGSIAQALALTVTGNAFVQGLDIGPFWPEADAFVFCGRVQFASTDGVATADPDEWLRQLRRDSAQLRLGVVPRHHLGMSDRYTTGFANGGSRWMIEISRSGGVRTWWEPEWTAQSQPGPSPWSVTYRRQGGPFAFPDPRPLSVIFVELSDTLDALLSLVESAAPEEAMSGWAENFRIARKALDETVGQWAPGDPGPQGFLSAEAYRMIHACRAAWVFGGMGSWNDGAYWGSVEAEGDRLSEALFHLLQEGIIAAANSTARPA